MNHGRDNGNDAWSHNKLSIRRWSDPLIQSQESKGCKLVNLWPNGGLSSLTASVIIPKISRATSSTWGGDLDLCILKNRLFKEPFCVHHGIPWEGRFVPDLPF